MTQTTKPDPPIACSWCGGVLAHGGPWCSPTCAELALAAQWRFVENPRDLGILGRLLSQTKEALRG